MRVPQMFLAALPLLLLAAPACKKKEDNTAPAASAPSADVLGKVDVPNDDLSKAFAGKILTHVVTNYTLADGNGMKFVYKSLTFSNDNTWWSDAVIGEGDDSVGCKEQGTWSMESASDEHTANVSLKMDKTTCPGREQSGMTRLNVNIAKGEYTISGR